MLSRIRHVCSLASLIFSFHFLLNACAESKSNQSMTPMADEQPGQADFQTGLSLSNSKFVTVQGRNFMLGNEIYYIKGVNYWPADYGWVAMWNSDAEWTAGKMQRIIEADFRRASALGSNTLRVIAPYAYFNGPESLKYHQRLTHVISIARTFNLRIILTLFDWASNDELAAANFPQHDVYLREFAMRYGNNPTVMAWDIQNEPDHRYADQPAIRPMVIEFLKRSYAKLKEFGVRQPVSAGLYGHYLNPRYPSQSINDPEGLLKLFDFTMFHWYESPDGLREAIKTVLKNDGKPVLIEELGIPSAGDRYKGSNKDNSCKLVENGTSTLASQNDLFREWGKVVREFGKQLSGVVVWDLIDHSDDTAKRADAFCPGDITAFFGMYQTNGQLKPAGEVFKDEFPLYQGGSSARILVERLFSIVLGRRCNPVECSEPIQRAVSEGTTEAVLRQSIQNTNQRLVRQWYFGYLGRLADKEGLDYYLEKLKNGVDCRIVGSWFLENVRFQGENGLVFSDADFVKKLYTGFMGRSPDSAGFAYWLQVLKSNPDRKVMAENFLKSDEFYSRCR